MAPDKPTTPNLPDEGKFFGDKEIITVAKERVHIDVESRVTGEVTVEKIVNTSEVDIPLTDLDTTYREERVPVNRVVDVMPAVRYNGDNLIVPVVREEEVVIRRLVLVEEIHLIKEVRRSERTETVTLKSEEVFITRRTPDSTVS